MPSNHLILCRPLLLPPSIFPSIRVFSNESALRIRWPKYWSFSFNISPSNEYSGLRLVGPPCSPRDTQESSPTPQFKSIKSLALSFCIVQLSHPNMTTGKSIALTRGCLCCNLGFPGGPSGKEPAYQCRRHKRLRFDPWVGKTPRRRACNPLQYSCLENPMDRGAWRAAVHTAARSRTRLC